MISRPPYLLSRDTFRTLVFDRDNHLCVHCGAKGQDAHHIIDRRLFPDGGYYLDNGATLCGPCHLLAESTELEAIYLRERIQATEIIIPPHLYRDEIYDKWGNIYAPNGLRIKGELFDDESVQKALAPVIHLFTDRIKYPRTYHLPWSPGKTDDDRVMEHHAELADEDVVITLKMDGEQTTIYSDGYCHARSIDSGGHESRDWVKALAARIGTQLPQGWRLCGENLWAQHSISYTELPSYFLIFSLWDGLKCLSWRETAEWAALLDMHTVSVLYNGPYDGNPVTGRLWDPSDGEGYVVRVSDSFHYRDFRRKVGKYVRKNHVHTHGHWMRQQVVKNGLK